MSRSRRPRPIGAAIYIGLVFAFLFVPLLVMIVFSLHAIPRMSLPFEGFSMRWYQEIVADTLVMRAFARTAIAAVVTGIVTGILGLAAALGLVKIGSRVRTMILVAALVPLAFPQLLYAIGLASLYGQLEVGFSLWGTIAGHVVVALPFVFLVIGAALDRFRFSLLEAASDLGASRARAFWSITLPIILPAVLGAMLLSMAISVDEFAIAFFTAGQEKTLPLVMYGRINQGIDPSLNAIGTVLLLVTTGLAFTAARRTTLDVG
jgi:spermidine/putrescine transport system permease protein